MTQWLQQARLRRPASGGWCIVVLRAAQPQAQSHSLAHIIFGSRVTVVMQLYPVNHIRNAAWNASRTQVTLAALHTRHDVGRTAHTSCAKASGLRFSASCACMCPVTCDVGWQHVFILDVDLVPDPGFYAALMRDYDR